MRPTELRKLENELHEFLWEMFEGLGRRERLESMSWYVTGLLLDGERKSTEPMAARLVHEASEISGMRQRLQECVSISSWSEDLVLQRLATKVEGELPGIEALVIDDTGFPKKGRHSVGVQRQYSGTLGRQDNCQVATSLHLAGEQGSACIALRLYLPEQWCSDGERRRKAKVPDEVVFARKWEIALQQIDDALRWGVRRHVVLADAGYGESTEFRDELEARKLLYVVGIPGEPVVWGPDSDPQIPPRKAGKGRPQTRYFDIDHPPISVRQLSATLPFRKVSWRQGSRGWQSSRFAVARVRTAHKHTNSAPPGAQQWLLCEWPAGEEAPKKFWLSNLPPKTSLATLVRLAKLRWRVERDYQELKQEIGLDHFEGRTWRGFHHHAALCAVAHGFLALRRALFPPEPSEVDDLARSPRLAANPAVVDRHLSPVPQAH
jgi:SRSO17 transposase